MNELLQKYYEYFKRDNSQFNSFYSIIINAYDLSKNEQIKIDLEELFEFFCEKGNYGYKVKTGRYTIFGGIHREEISKKCFEENKKASFNWFYPSAYLIKRKQFIFSEANNIKAYCKAYLSIKPEEYVNVIIKLQDFINQLYHNHDENEVGQCKFRNVPANDSITIRFACKEHYIEFIEFLKENKDIIDSFDTPNLFMPQDEYGVSLIIANGGSYNYFVTKIIWDYMEHCKKNNYTVSVEGIVDFINNYDCSKDSLMNVNDEDTVLKYKLVLSGIFLSQPNEELLYIMGLSNGKALKLINKE